MASRHSIRGLAMTATGPALRTNGELPDHRQRRLSNAPPQSTSCEQPALPSDDPE
jgi:hypothetical protein